jgi:putative PIN family toxin of toxin-antitoxin system
LGPGKVIRRVVLDTNVVVSALLFERGRLSWLRPAWMAADFRPLVSHATAAELLRVLSYPKFHLTDEEIATLLGDFLPFSEPVEVPVALNEPTAELPRLPDPDDRIFLQLAEAGTAEFLVTGDQDLLAVPTPGDYRIISPTEFAAILRG